MLGLLIGAPRVRWSRVLLLACARLVSFLVTDCLLPVFRVFSRHAMCGLFSTFTIQSSTICSRGTASSTRRPTSSTCARSITKWASCGSKRSARVLRLLFALERGLSSMLFARIRCFNDPHLVSSHWVFRIRSSPSRKPRRSRLSSRTGSIANGRMTCCSSRKRRCNCLWRRTNAINAICTIR